MDRTIAKIYALTLNTLQDILRKRVLYVVLILVVLVVAAIFSQLQLLQMASDAGESTTKITAGFVGQALDTWDFFACFLAVFFGAVGISSEVTAKTIVHVLSRPVGRTVYLTGRWFGTLLFLWGFQCVGILFALLIVRIFDVHLTPMFWVGCADMFFKPVLYSGVSLSLSVFLPPVLAGSCTFLLTIASTIIGGYLHHPVWILRQFAKLAYYIPPAEMPVDLISASFTKELLHPDYTLYFLVMGENILYAIMIFLVACAIFARRELKLR
ncbi:MAG: family transporter protein [Verrucomicrobiota bacterium]